ncbi:hypothetical protein QOT17_016919 [Balamuthia mandrillaris]
MGHLHFFLLFVTLAVTGSRGEIHEPRYVNGSCTETARDGTQQAPFCHLQSALEPLPYNGTVLVLLQGQFVRTPSDDPFAIADNQAAKLILQPDPQQTEPASFSCENSPPYFNCRTLFSVSGENTIAGSVILFRGLRFQGYSGGLLEASSLGSSFVEVVLEEVTVEGCGQDSAASGFAVNDGVGSTLRVERSTFHNNSYSALLTARNVIVEDCDFRGNENSGATIKGELGVAVRRSSLTGGTQTIDAWNADRVEVSQVTFKGTDRAAVNIVMSPSVHAVSFVMEHCLFEDLIAPVLSYKRGTGVVKREFTSPADTPFASSSRPPQKRQLTVSQMTIVDSTFRRVSMNTPVVEILEFSYLANADVTDYYLADLLFEDNNEVTNSDSDPAEMNMRIDVGTASNLTTVTMERLQFHRSAVPSVVVPAAEDERLLFLILRDIIVQDSGQLSFDGVSLQMENVVVERSEGLFLRRLANNSFIKDSFFLFNEAAGITVYWSEPTLFVDGSSISWNEGGGIVVNGSSVVVSRSSIWGNRMEGGLACSFGASIIAENDISIYKNNYDRTLQAFTELTCDGSCSIAIPSTEDGCALAATCPQGFDACSSCQGTNECMDCTGVPFGQNNCSSPLRNRLSEDNETTVVLQFSGSQPHATLLPINQTTGEAEHNYAQWVWQSVWKEEEEFVLEGGAFVRCGPVVSKSKSGKIRSLRMIHSMQLENGASLVLEQYLLGEDTTFWLGGNQSAAPANSLKSSIRIYDWVVGTGSSLNLQSKLFFSDPIFALVNEADEEDGDTDFASLTILTDATTTSLSVALWFLAEQQYSDRLEFGKKQEGTEDEIQLTFQFEGPFSSLEYDPDFSVLLGGSDGDDGSEEDGEDGEENDDTLKIVLPAVLVSVVVVGAIVGVIATRVVMKWKTKRSLKRAPHLKAVNY